MKAARSYGIKDIRIEEIEMPEIGDNDVMIKVKYAGICGSDIHAYHNGWALPTKPHPITGKELPVTLGHEPSGEIVGLGRSVTEFVLGDKVTVEPLIYCGKCEACKKGFYNTCEKSVGEDGSGNIIGFAVDGAFAEYMIADAQSVYKLTPELDYELGALAEPTAVAVQAVQKSGLKVGQTAAIFGAGPIGLLVAIVAMEAGATDLIISDVSEERLAIARDLGVRHIFNPAKVNLVREIKKITGGGVDIAFDIAGVQSTLDSAIDSVKNNGVIMDVAVFGKDPVVRLSDILMRGIDIYTTLCYSNVYPEAIRLLSKNPVAFRKVITKVIKLDDIVADGLEYLLKDKTQAKILVSP